MLVTVTLPPLEGLCQALLTVLPQSWREVATTVMLEVAHMMILGANTSVFSCAMPTWTVPKLSSSLPQDFIEPLKSVEGVK